MTDIIKEACHVCGGPLSVKHIEKLVRGGMNTAIVEVDAEVCQRCGEQLFSVETAQRLEDIRSKLAKQETSEYVPIGQTYQVSQEEQTSG